MEYICDYIKQVRKPYDTEDLNFSIMEQGYEMNMTISEMRRILNKKIGKSIRNVKVFPENWCVQRATIISFRYKNLHCEIREHFGTQRDYLCVKMVPFIK